MKSPHDIIQCPMVTEKNADLKAQNKHVFKVHPKATKIEIVEAVEKLFNVEVGSVNIQNYMGKPKRAGKSMKQGRRSNWKKAIVSLTKGSIEII